MISLVGAGGHKFNQLHTKFSSQVDFLSSPMGNSRWGKGSQPQKYVCAFCHTCGHAENENKPVKVMFRSNKLWVSTTF